MIEEYTASKTKIAKINEKLVSLIINNNLPFSIVDSEEFQDFIDTIRKNYYKLPCRQTLRYELIPNIYSTIKTCLILELEKMKFGCVTTDVWTSISNIAYLSLTIHFIDFLNFQFVSRVLSLQYLTEDHNQFYLHETI